MPPVLGYWAIRGLAQPIRLVLKYLGVEFEDKLYHVGDAPDFKNTWFDEKFTLGLDFPNLPYYVDGDVKISQSNCIMRYIGRKHKLDGSTEEEKVRVDLLTDEAMDFRMNFAKLCYNQKFAELKADYLKNVKTKLQQFENFLGDKNYFVGNNITFPDFLMYEILDAHKVLEPSSLDGFLKIQAFVKRIETLPSIKAYLASDMCIKSPLNGKMAAFVG